MMESHELEEFHKRCVAAQVKNRKIANAEAHVAALEAEAGPVAPRANMHKHSPDHLLALIEKVKRVRAGEEKAAVAEEKPKKKSAPKKKKAPKKKAKEEVVEAAPEETVATSEEAPAPAEDAPHAEEEPKEEA